MALDEVVTVYRLKERKYIVQQLRRLVKASWATGDKVILELMLKTIETLPVKGEK